MEKTRRSGRIAKEVAILLLGTDTTGKVFCEDTKTVVLSRHGAGIVSRHRFAPDDVLTLRLPSSSKEAEVRLVGQIGGEQDRYVYGVAFVDAKLDFWQIEFPPAESCPPGSGSLDLECSVCHELQQVQPHDIEADVYSVNQSILRYCPVCGTATLWKRSEGARPVKKAPEPKVRSADDSKLAALEPGPYSSLLTTAVTGSFEPIEAPVAVLEASQPVAAVNAEPASAPSASATAARPKNQRRDVRTRVSFCACIRQGESGDDIVECENVSKGGLSFRSLKRYERSSLIEVAVPYSPGSPAIFVWARIVHVRELPGGRLFLHGAEYGKPSSTSRQF